VQWRRGRARSGVAQRASGTLAQLPDVERSRRVGERDDPLVLGEDGVAQPTVGATVSRRSDTLFLVTTTQGGLERLTQQFRVAPFAHSIVGRLGVPVAVGAGAGATARSAEANALAAVEDAVGRDGKVAVYLDESGVRRELRTDVPAEPTDGGTGDAAALIDARAVEIISRIASLAGTGAGRRLVADVDTVAEAMQVTPRTGRRMLKELVQAGLAWPVPPAWSSSGGRPRQQFRLLTEKLDTTELA
jgi:hypothetical protein